MARNFTRELLKAVKPGRSRIVYSSAPYEGWAVEYSPRNSHDRSPWRLAGFGDSGFRFSGRECHVQTFRYAVVPIGNEFGIMDTEGDGSGLLVSRPDRRGLEHVPGAIASGRLYSSRYAAREDAKRLEADGPLARIDLTPEQEMELHISAARTSGQTGVHIVSPKGRGWMVIDSQTKTLGDLAVFTTREAAQRTARHLDGILAKQGGR